METMRLMGICLAAGVMVMVLRQVMPAAAGILCAVFGCLLLTMMMDPVKEAVETIWGLLERTGLSESSGKSIIKATGIALMAQITARICTDLDAPGVAQHVDMCARLALLGIAAPVFAALTRTAMDVLR